MRRRKKRKAGFPRGLALAAAAAVVPVLAWRLAGGLSWLGKAGEGAAIIAAAIHMPDGGIAVLEERFRAEIYNPEGDHATGEAEQGAPLPQPPAAPGASGSEAPERDEAKPAEKGPRIPQQYAAPVISEDFSGKEGGNILGRGAGLIRNETNYDNGEIGEILSTPHPIRFDGSPEPQVLILHTHATESFEKYDSPSYDTRNTWRSTDNRNNMVAVGDAFAQVLEEGGVGVIHDTTQHDYPSYNGSYERSAETISAYLEEYPSIKVVLDLHRDAMQRGDAIVKPTAVLDGRKAAQIMIISACDDGAMEIPLWRENLRFAAAYQDYMERYFPGLTRPVYLCYRKYNMDLTTGSLLLEFGSNANTLDEAVYSAEMAGHALVNLIRENVLLGAEEEARAQAEAAAWTDTPPGEDGAGQAATQEESGEPGNA